MNILLYVDDSKHWHAAARALGEFVRTQGGHVTVLTTLWIQSKRRHALDDALRLLELPDDRVDTLHHAGLVENVVPAEARRGDYDLAVVGRLGSLDWLTNGLIAHLVVRRTPASVLLVRGRFEGVRRILVCTQGPRHGSEVLDRAARVARAFDAAVTVLHVASQMPLTYESEEEYADVREHFLDTDLPEAKHLLELRERLPTIGVRGDVKVRVGLVVEEILEEIHDGRHDMLVIGAHDPRGRGGLLYQDLASLLIRASPVSVLVVRDTQPPHE